MNSIHNNGENDRKLRDDLEKVGRAYEQLPHEEPPELLDQAIRNTAHRAVEQKPHWMKFGWLHGLTTAAVVVLALSLVIQQREQPPGFDEMRVNEPAGLAREKAGKKQSAARQTKDLRKAVKEEEKVRQDTVPSAPASAPPYKEVMEVAAEAEPAASEQRPRSMYAADELLIQSDAVDPDQADGEPVLRESVEHEADSMADTAAPTAISRQTQAAAITVSPEKPANAAADAEQVLTSIIKLKQAGDESWRAALDEFRETYPEYPLPKELLE